MGRFARQHLPGGLQHFLNLSKCCTSSRTDNEFSWVIAHYAAMAPSIEYLTCYRATEESLAVAALNAQWNRMIERMVDLF
ncbi:hypothetical protein TU80_19640 [Pseudomonas veronii]|nr:hypothetical protein TU80_19640 [Pseudomonas veronii]